MSAEEEARALERVLRYDAAFVPRFAQRFGRHLLDALDLGPKSSALDLAFRTGYPSVDLLDRRDDLRVIALDTEAQHLELARARAGAALGRRLFVKQGAAYPLSFGDGVFTHVFANLVDRLGVEREGVIREAARVLEPRGQLAFTLCLRGSFAEVQDLLREVALARDLPGVTERVERYAASLPDEDTLRAELTRRGFDEVLVESWEFTLDHPSAESLFGDAAVEFAALAEWRWCAEGAPQPESVLRALRHAIDTYHQGRTFSLTVVGGCVTARRAAA